MLYQLLADFVVIIHFLFIIFVAVGSLLVLRWRGFAWIHIPAAIWGALIEFMGWICPLTPLENFLRKKGQLAAYTTGFIEHYILPIIYPEGLTRKCQILLGTVIITINIIIYGCIFYRFQWNRKMKGK
jgi:hypothetical protein